MAAKWQQKMFDGSGHKKTRFRGLYSVQLQRLLLLMYMEHYFVHLPRTYDNPR